MKMNTIRKVIAAVLVLVMLGTVAFGATISGIKYRKGTVTVEYYVGGDNATIWVYDAADPTDVIYVDQETADGSFSFGIPDEFEGEAVTVRMGGENEPVAEETVSVTPTPAPTPDPESIEAGGIYGYVNKEDFTTTVINYDEKYMVTEADFKEEPNTAAYGQGSNGMVIYDEYSGAEGVFYIEGHALSGETVSYYFDPIKTGKAKISIKFMYAKFPQAGSDGEVPFFSILDGTTGNYAIRNCSAQYTYTGKVPVAGMYFYNGPDDYTRYRNVGVDSSWNTLTYIIDMDTKTYDLDYNGTLYEDNAFYADVTELSKIYFHGSRAQWGSNYYIDEIKVMAVEADEYPTHTVTFYNDDKTTVLETKEVKDTRRIEPIEAATRRGYTFMGWYLEDGTAADFSSVTADMNVYAKYLPRCTVDFYNEDKEELLASVTVDYETEAKIIPPTKEGYTFMGWVDADGTEIDLTAVTENHTVYAWFEKQPTIYYYDLDAEGKATLCGSQTIDYATDAKTLAAPTSRTDMKFIGWGTADGTIADLSNVRGDRKVYAIYGTEDTTAVEDFETIITRVNNAAGAEVMTSSYVTGGTYTDLQGDTGFENETIFAHNDSRAGGLQKGWQTTEVDGSTVWKHTSSIAFNHDDLKLYPDKAETSDMFHVGYDFKMDRWNNAQSASATAGGFGSVFGKTSGASASSELVLVTASTRDNRGFAVYDRSTSKWVSIIPYDAANPDLNWHHVDYYIDMTSQKISIALDGTIKATVPLGASEVVSIDYLRFSLLHGGHIGTQSWFNLDNIEIQAYTNSGVTVAPTYYTVTFLAEDGVTPLGTARVAEGKAAVYEGETPVKTPTTETEYTFTGWSKDISSVISDMSVTPVFSPSPRKYNVTFIVDGNSTVVPTAYGTAAVAPANPTKTADAQYTYAFKNWDKDFSNITGDLIVTAVFESTLRSYKVIFYDDDKTSVLKEETVSYGGSATAPATPTKDGDDKVSYEFKAWVDANGKTIDFTNITGETNVYASYEATYTMKTIEFFWGDVNTDNTVDGQDSMAINRGITGGQKAYGDYTIGKVFANSLLWGDINGDGTVDGQDSMAINRGITGGQKVYGDYTIGVKASFEIPVE